ncbi:MAG: urea ABC transporter permease subunit UrtB, partial [Verrucomicrobiales bacterium]|nr:urea ABC transporter permease subunit UrtB [Verrucomicrobiales bacterium]
DLEPVDTSSLLRRAMKTTTDLLALGAPDAETRAEAARKLGLMQRGPYVPILEARLETETDPTVKEALEEGLAITYLLVGDREQILTSVKTLGEIKSIGGIDYLNDLISYQEGAGDSKDQEIIDAATLSLNKINAYLSLVDFWGTCFRGLSLGSVLLIVALGLAITFGLMGVINMAHGELIAVGAYATYLTEVVFTSWFGDSGLGFELYFVFALPVSFLAAALLGLVLERGVIQFLYKRPLESLLATWGVSLILQQVFRLIFGAANRQVNSPRWLMGSFEIADVTLNYNRLFVIGFAVLIVIGTWLLMTRTPLGLCIRAVMQNRDMAASMGIRTARVRTLTFCFGAGLAGLAGAFLSQIGNVGPSLGQSYIVDSFMVVVAGGVGNIIGTVISAFGIGVVDQVLQPTLGPVMGKICVLVAIILFLQWRPGGLFPARSRSLEG